MCVCVVCHLLFTFFLLTCSTPLWWEDLVRAPFVSHQNFVDLHLRSNFFFFSFKFTFDTNRYSFLLEIFQIWSGPWAHCKKVRLIPTVQYRSCADLLERTLSPTTWLIMRIEFSTMFFFFPLFFLKDYQLPMLPPTPDVATRDTLVLDCLIQQVSRIDSDLPPILYF